MIRMILPKLPVATAQAAIGTVRGIGRFKGGNSVRAKTRGHILRGRLFTPLVASPLALGIHFGPHLRYIS